LKLIELAKINIQLSYTSSDLQFTILHINIKFQKIQENIAGAKRHFFPRNFYIVITSISSLRPCSSDTYDWGVASQSLNKMHWSC